MKCRPDIRSVLQATTKDKQLKPDQRVIVRGLLSQLEDATNVFLLEFMYDVLTLLKKLIIPVDQVHTIYVPKNIWRGADCGSS